MWSLSLILVIFMWVVTLIGSCVTGTLVLANVGEGNSDWEKKFWWDFCKKNIKGFAVFSPLFILSNYLIYLLVT